MKCTTKRTRKKLIAKRMQKTYEGMSSGEVAFSLKVIRRTRYTGENPSDHLRLIAQHLDGQGAVGVAGEAAEPAPVLRFREVETLVVVTTVRPPHCIHLVEE